DGWAYGQERHGQEHAHPQHAGARQASPRRSLGVRHTDDRRRALPHRPPGHRVRSRGTRHFSQPHRARESGDGRAGGPRGAARLENGGWKLSGGEQQMLTIGRALLTNPDLLILDEATEGLAPMIAHEIWRIIGEIRANGIATLIVDKNYAAVTAIANRSVILVKGRVVFDGDGKTLFGQPDLLHKHLGV